MVVVVVVVVRARFDFLLLIISALVYLVVEIFLGFLVRLRCKINASLGSFCSFNESRLGKRKTVLFFSSFLLLFLFCFVLSLLLF